MALTSRILFTISRISTSNRLQILKLPPVCTIKRWVAPTLNELYRRKARMTEPDPMPRSSFYEWNYKAEIYAFNQRLQEKFDENLLKQAFIHKSYLFKIQQETDQALITEQSGEKENSDMISKGHHIISQHIKNQFQNKYPHVVIDAIEDHLMNEEQLAYCAKHLGMTDLILTEEYPVSTETLSNTFKAVISALEQSTDLTRAHTFINDFLISQLGDLEVFDIWEPKEPYKYLMEMLKGQTVEPRLCNQSGASTILANYQVGLYDEKKQLMGIGWGESIDIAKDTAALHAIRKIYRI